jgi:hypothetical protein
MKEGRSEGEYDPLKTAVKTLSIARVQLWAIKIGNVNQR